MAGSSTHVTCLFLLLLCWVFGLSVQLLCVQAIFAHPFFANTLWKDVFERSVPGKYRLLHDERPRLLRNIWIAHSNLRATVGRRRPVYSQKSLFHERQRAPRFASSRVVELNR